VPPPQGQNSGHATDALWRRHAAGHTHSIAQLTLTRVLWCGNVPAGAHQGQQRLSAAKLAEALYKTDAKGLPSSWTANLVGEGRYQLSFWMVIGALAVSFWQRPRATLDLDFEVLADANGLERLRVSASSRGFGIDESWMDWNPLLKESEPRLVYGGIPVDILLPRDEQDRQALQRPGRKRVGATIL